MDPCKSTLSAPRQKLLQIIDELYFGEIGGLVIRASEPCFSPAPRIIQEIKLGGEGAPKKSATGDYALKQYATDLFAQFDRLPDGTVVTIGVRHGHPVLLTLTRSA
jgi:hypothetical protein